jgi:uncharacterized membrane protein
MTAADRTAAVRNPAPDLDRSISRLLTAATYVSVALLVVGVGLMVVTGTSPLDSAPDFDPGTIIPAIVGLQPAGFLWLGIVLVIATPTLRVLAALVGYLRSGERTMAAVSIAILVVLAIGVVLGYAAA